MTGAATTGVAGPVGAGVPKLAQVTFRLVTLVVAVPWPLATVQVWPTLVAATACGACTLYLMAQQAYLGALLDRACPAWNLRK